MFDVCAFAVQPETFDSIRPVAVTSSDIDNVTTIHDLASLRLVDTLPLPPLVMELGGKPHDLTISGFFAFVTYLGTSDGKGYVASYIRARGHYRFFRLLETAADPHVSPSPPLVMALYTPPSTWREVTGCRCVRNAVAALCLRCP